MGTAWSAPVPVPARAEQLVVSQSGRLFETRGDLADLGQQAAQFARFSRSEATQRAYRSDFVDFSAWCYAAELSPLPAAPETVGLYLAAFSALRQFSTLRRRVAAIAVAHRLAGERLDTSSPAIKDVLAGIRRKYGSRPSPKNAISVQELRSMLRRLPDSAAGVRDRALLLTGFAGAFRRSELAALDVADLRVSTRGAAIMVRRSKTDQEGAGHLIGIPRSRKATCPVGALEAWIAAARLGEGPLFRPVNRHGQVADHRLSDEAIAEIVKRAAARIGLEPAKYAGHSLRRGFVTAASQAGADIAQIMKQSRHRSVAVAMGYIEEAQLFNNAASQAIGL